MRHALARIVAAALVWSAALGPAAAEPFLDVYTGENFTRDADVHVKQPAAGNDFTIHDLSFSPRLSDGAPYYGVRAGYFFPEELSWFGLAVEFFHFKIVGETGDTRQISGTRGGRPVDSRVPVNTVVQQFESSNGVAYLMLDALARASFFRGEDYPHGRVQLYGGAGVGPVFTHAASTIEGVSRVPGYELGGVGGQAFAGARLLLLPWVGLFVEGKATYSRLTMGVARGGEADVTEQSAHVVGGLTFTLP